MSEKRFPDSRLVYLHCSSIFSGAHAQFRKQKIISQCLKKHKASIKILTEEFTLPAIAAVAKELLEDRVFESSARAKLRYPELFQPSASQEAERAASEAEILRIEAEAAQDINPTSEDEEDLDIEKDAEHEAASKSGTKIRQRGIVPTSCNELQQSTPQAYQALSIPRLHPVYLPFKTKHEILVLVQSLLEESCFEFGNTWVPDLMEAQNWYDVEAVELTEWTKRIMKFTKSLPPAAIKPIAGKTIADVLFGTNTLRHSAVHRKPTSGAGVVQMLGAAVTFADALNDSRRAEKIAEIKVQLEASIEEIIQHQNLLDRKLTDQLREIANRRAELDELERSSIEEMLAADKRQRSSVGASIEHVLVGARQTSNPGACSHGSSFDGAKAESDVDERIEGSRIDCTRKASDVLSIHERSPRGDWAYYPSVKPVRDDQFHTRGRSDSSVEEELGVSNWTVPITRSKGKGKGKGKEENGAAVSGWSIFAAEETPFNTAEEAEPAEEPSFVRPERAFPDEERSVMAPEAEPPLENAPPTEQAYYAKHEPLPENVPRTEEPIWLQVSDDPFEPTPAPDIAPTNPTSAEDADVLAPPPGPTSSTTYHDPEVTSTLSVNPVDHEAAARETPTEDGFTIMLRILAGSRIRRCVVSIRVCTRTAILNRARSFCTKCRQDDQEWATLLGERWDLALLSWKMNGVETDVETDVLEDLASLIREIGSPGIPEFTLRVS
ncbi:hypothetical protein Q9189_000298 [Teloschistes chrysophthalmus]